MKTKDRGPRLERKQHWTLLRYVSRASWPVDGKRRVASAPDMVRHFRQRAQAAPRTRTPSRAVSETLNALRDRFAIQVHAGHNNDAAFAPVIGCRKNASMPERENRAISRL